MELNPKGMLMQRLDAGLQAKAEELMAPRDKEGHPLIGNIYALQCIAEMHIYLRTVHEFRPEEISDLLYFEDPLRVAQHCWEENTDIYAFRISDLIKKYNLKEVYPAAKPPVKESLKSRLEEAKQMVRASSPSRAATAKGTER